MVEPLACVLRGAERVPHGRVLVVGQGFIGRLFAAVLARRGDEVFAIDRDPRRGGREPDGPVHAAILCAPGGAGVALDLLEPAGTLLVFADAGPLDTAGVYHRGADRARLALRDARSTWRRRPRSCPSSTLPEPTVLPLERFDEGLELYRRGEALKVVFTP